MESTSCLPATNICQPNMSICIQTYIHMVYMLYMSFGLFINYIGLLVEGPPLEVRTCAAHLINLPLVADGWNGRKGKLITNNTT